MKVRSILVLVVLLGATGAGWTQNLVLDYVDGTVELRTATGGWKALDVGATVASDAVVRLRDGGVAELSSGTAKIHLGKDGTYQLSPALAQSQKKADILGLTNKQVSRLLGVGNPSGVNVANMGARGAAQGDETGLSWASEDTGAEADGPEAVQALMDAQDWQGALAAVQRALRSQPSDPQTLLFEKAVILSQLGLAAGALKALKEADYRPGESRYFEATLLIGGHALETEEYDLVLASTTEALALQPEKGVAQSLLLERALAWQGKGDSVQAQALLNQVVRLEPQSDAGREASRLLAP